MRKSMAPAAFLAALIFAALPGAGQWKAGGSTVGGWGARGGSHGYAQPIYPAYYPPVYYPSYYPSYSHAYYGPTASIFSYGLAGYESRLTDPYPQSSNGGPRVIILAAPPQETRVVYVPSYFRPSNGPSLAELAAEVRARKASYGGPKIVVREIMDGQ